ncbi:MAG: 2-oxoacid:acceptor oxidoreductase family protein, partial [Bdellovibrionales bacterium]|nr:2-oxoacid:acceptor oxidoreductase family protein [Bdellovibrionales bacterium]
NGSGSQSSNNVLVKSLFRMGVPVTGKNLFPSNIQGLPTWFTIRANPQGFTARRTDCDIVVAMNPASAVQDVQSVISGGYLILNDAIKLTDDQLRSDINIINVPFKKLIDDVTKEAKLKKLLVNMIYVGVVARLLEIDQKVIDGVVSDMFKSKKAVVDSNLSAISVGFKWADENLDPKAFPFRAQTIPNGSKGKILVDGNTAAGLGWIFGGCTFVGWYPITPSSSVVEAFQKYAGKMRKDDKGQNRVAIVQAEDELSSICMVTGAGWAGARAATATSGPGMSLMAETVGLSYFAEIPAVIWNVQRGGPSTGLPTRTQQSDVLSAATLSHGDTQHVVLFPKDPTECFEFGEISFNLAERLQTTIFVLSDLD